VLGRQVELLADWFGNISREWLVGTARRGRPREGDGPQSERRGGDAADDATPDRVGAPFDARSRHRQEAGRGHDERRTGGRARGRGEVYRHQGGDRPDERGPQHHGDGPVPELVADANRQMDQCGHGERGQQRREQQVQLLADATESFDGDGDDRPGIARERMRSSGEPRNAGASPTAA